jgi:predicted dehydrogenase
MASDKLRFGICGLGFMGRTHFARLCQHPRAAVVAVCDCDPALRRGEWEGRFGNLDLGSAPPRKALCGVAAYETAEELIADANVEVVLIALPTPQHAPLSIAALQAGKHVLCEKPMAYRPSDCNRMLAAAKASGRTLMIGHCIRFWPQYELIKRYVDEGRIGALRFVTLRRLTSPPTHSAGGWLLAGAQSGGALLDVHLHDIDFAQHLLGLPDAVLATGMKGVSGAIDHVAATYRYADGRYAVLEGGWALTSPRPFEMSITVHGERGTLEWSSGWGNEVRHYDGTRTALIACEGDAYQREDDYFIDCVLSDRTPERCLPTSSRTSVALAWLEQRAVETGRVVPLSGRLHAAWTR